MTLKIEKIFVFVIDEGKGEEGILGVKTAFGCLPWVNSHEHSLKKMKEVADTGQHKYRIIEFSSRRDITDEVI